MCIATGVFVRTGRKPHGGVGPVADARRHQLAAAQGLDARVVLRAWLKAKATPAKAVVHKEGVIAIDGVIRCQVEVNARMIHKFSMVVIQPPVVSVTQEAAAITMEAEPADCLVDILILVALWFADLVEDVVAPIRSARWCITQCGAPFRKQRHRRQRLVQLGWLGLQFTN